MRIEITCPHCQEHVVPSMTTDRFGTSHLECPHCAGKSALLAVRESEYHHIARLAEEHYQESETYYCHD